MSNNFSGNGGASHVQAGGVDQASGSAANSSIATSGYYPTFSGFLARAQ